MNERIRELLKQSCGFEYDEAGKELTPILVGKDLAKFAQLIVQECADIALEQKKCVEDQKTHNPNDNSWNRARIQQSQLIVDRIREHFEAEQ